MPCEQVHCRDARSMSCWQKVQVVSLYLLHAAFLVLPNSNLGWLSSWYTLSNKNPSAWNFLSPELEVRWRTVAIIIRVVLLSPYLRIHGVSLSSIHVWKGWVGNCQKLKTDLADPELSGGWIPLPFHSYGHHHHKFQGLDSLIRSISRVTTALANVSSVFQLFSFVVVCSGMISKGFGFVAFFASVKASSVCIHLSCLVRM